MNPMKVLKEALPNLGKVLESIHAHLEEQLKTQEEILAVNNQILEELKKNNERKDP